VLSACGTTSQYLVIESLIKLTLISLCVPVGGNSEGYAVTPDGMIPHQLQLLSQDTNNALPHFLWFGGQVPFSLRRF
jgi:hypothetical protein